ncbi:protein OSB1, mitochondrial-like isoform X1 [Oryza glaberrima]|uniref:protein OSB1, mitochondrial-like isoform X1 n=1 Tax=Oryza glaberrima TaxID=4538 RepID=UPI00224C4287|nr:protein OSB1, mitochondrial-like isoform X1 [Oryza glaberrima]
MLRSLAGAAEAGRSSAAAALRRSLHAGGREEVESVAYRMSMLRPPPVVPRRGLPRNSCSLIGRLDGPVRPCGGSSDERPMAYTFLSVSSSPSSPPSLSPSNFRVTLNLQGELAHVSLKHLKQNDLVYVSGLLNSYHKVDPSGEKHTFYKIHVTDLNYVLDQNQRPQNDENSSDKSSMLSTTDEILTEKKYIDRLRLWQVFFASPYEWWDNRQSKPYSYYPDFKHKDTGEKLWLRADDPPWVRRQLELQDQQLAENGHRDGSRTLKNHTWKSQDFDCSPSQDFGYSDDEELLHSSGA